MKKIKEWKIAQKIAASGRKGVIVGIIVAILLIIAVVVIVMKFNLLKKHVGSDELEDYYLDDDLDDDGSPYTSDKDFV